MATAIEMVQALEQALSKNVGVAEVIVDGQKVRYDRAQAMQELDYWRQRAAKQNGKRPRFRGIDVGTAW